MGPCVGPGVGPGIGPCVGPAVGPGVGPCVGPAVGPGVDGRDCQAVGYRKYKCKRSNDMRSNSSSSKQQVPL